MSSLRIFFFTFIYVFFQATQSALSATPVSEELPNSLGSSSAWSSSSFLPRSLVSTASSWPSISTQNKLLVVVHKTKSKRKSSQVSLFPFFLPIRKIADSRRFVVIRRNVSAKIVLAQQQQQQQKTTTITTAYFYSWKKCFSFSQLKEHCWVLLHSHFELIFQLVICSY